MGEEPIKGGKHVPCPYYREPATDELIGCCNDDLAEIPSKVHQDCLCRSCSGIYASFCPIYAKFERRKLCAHRWSTLKRIFLNGHKRPVYKGEPDEQMNYQANPEESMTQEETAAVKA